MAGMGLSDSHMNIALGDEDLGGAAVPMTPVSTTTSTPKGERPEGKRYFGTLRRQVTRTHEGPAQIDTAPVHDPDEGIAAAQAQNRIRIAQPGFELLIQTFLMNHITGSATRTGTTVGIADGGWMLSEVFYELFTEIAAQDMETAVAASANDAAISISAGMQMAGGVIMALALGFMSQYIYKKWVLPEAKKKVKAALEHIDTQITDLVAIHGRIPEQETHFNQLAELRDTRNVIETFLDLHLSKTVQRDAGHLRNKIIGAVLGWTFGKIIIDLTLATLKASSVFAPGAIAVHALIGLAVGASEAFGLCTANYLSERSKSDALFEKYNKLSAPEKKKFAAGYGFPLIEGSEDAYTDPQNSKAFWDIYKKKNHFYTNQIKLALTCAIAGAAWYLIGSVIPGFDKVAEFVGGSDTVKTVVKHASKAIFTGLAIAAVFIAGLLTLKAYDKPAKKKAPTANESLIDNVGGHSPKPQRRSALAWLRFTVRGKQAESAFRNDLGPITPE